jgi:hypothetical protein
MNEHDDVLCQIRESFSGLRMDTPVERVFARGRARRRRRLSGVTAAAAVTAGAGAAAVALALGGSAPAAGNPASSPGAASLAAFSVTSGPGGSTTLVLRKGQHLDPAALRRALARHGIPALVTAGSFCRSAPAAPGGIGQVVRPSGDAIVINGKAMPAGARLSIGYFPQQIRMGLVKDGARLSCGSGSGQPAVRVPPRGTPIRK